MACNILRHKQSALNSREKLLEEGIIPEFNVNRIVSPIAKFDEVVGKMNTQAQRDYQVSIPLYTREKREGGDYYIVPNKDAFEAIDNKRKELGIFDSQESFGSYWNKQVDKLYQEPDESTFYQKTQQTIVKEGVVELFESNPELANTVYEALGFKTNITQNNKSYYRGQIEQPTIDKDGNLVLYAKEDELYKRAGLKSKGVSMTDNLQSAIEYGNGQLEVAQNLASESYDAEQELERLSENGYYLIQIPKDISNEIVKEAGEVKVVGDKIVVPKGKFKIEQVIDGVETQITPQQKQQATFMFSEFLDVYLQDFEQVESVLKEEKIIDKKCS